MRGRRGAFPTCLKTQPAAAVSEGRPERRLAALGRCGAHTGRLSAARRGPGRGPGGAAQRPRLRGPSAAGAPPPGLAPPHTHHQPAPRPEVTQRTPGHDFVSEPEWAARPCPGASSARADTGSDDARGARRALFLLRLRDRRRRRRRGEWPSAPPSSRAGRATLPAPTAGSARLDPGGESPASGLDCERARVASPSPGPRRPVAEAAAVRWAGGSRGRDGPAGKLRRQRPCSVSAGHAYPPERRGRRAHGSRRGSGDGGGETRGRRLVLTAARILLLPQCLNSNGG